MSLLTGACKLGTTKHLGEALLGTGRGTPMSSAHSPPARAHPSPRCFRMSLASVHHPGAGNRPQLGEKDPWLSARGGGITRSLQHPGLL